MAEQVSHHPPVSAFHFEAPYARFYGAVHPKLTFRVTSLAIHQRGLVTLELPRYAPPPPTPPLPPVHCPLTGRHSPYSILHTVECRAYCAQLSAFTSFKLPCARARKCSTLLRAIVLIRIDPDNGFSFET